MQIKDSNILLSSQHQAVERREVKASLNFWTGDAGQPATATSVVLDKVTLSSQSQQLVSSQKTESLSDTGDEALDPRMQMLVALMERMTGNKIRIFSAQDMAPAEPLPALRQPSGATPPRAGFGLEYDYHETYYEREQTTFSAEGVIHTADGQEINFSLNLEMDREYFEQTDVSVRVGDARQMKDPLVVNFGGNAAQLADIRFAFDLDSDGKTEQIPFLKAGSGFLALDKNRDGAINNGTELFGAATGDGFRELAGYDEDRNGFIDEKDSVFQQLRLLTGDTQRRNLLSALTEKGIGAIYLGNAATPFNLTDAHNAVDGQVRSSGIYVKEDGSVGSVQQIDLSV